MSDPNFKKFECLSCDKQFASRFTLTRHKRNVHGIEHSTSTNNKLRLICPGSDDCSLQFSRSEQLTHHLKEIHGVEIESEEHDFETEEDFLNWKYLLQQTTASEYVKDTATKTLKDGVRKDYFICHRSNKRPLLVKRKRALKSQGSNKTGKFCPSRIDVVYKKDQSISVKYWKTHHGHSNDLGHLSLDKATKDHLAGKLQDGVTFGHILDEVRSQKDLPPRLMLLERKDLHNIVRDHNIAYTTKRHTEDALSVRLWVEEMQHLGEDSPVIFFKEQGDDHLCLQKEDFLLIIMTSFQASQIVKFGHDKICVDSTHGTNGYDIELITLMTVDEFGAGCPVAYCFSSKCDEGHLSLFFSKIKEKVGRPINATSFMSDDAPAFYNAWCSVMSVPKHKLLCSWHVDRCWRKNLSKVKGGNEKKSLVYKTMKVLLQDLSTKEDFSNLLKQTVANLLNDPDTHDYGEYFVKCYAGRPDQWAYCYRQGLGINTNMYLESFHKSLKHIYLEGKKIKRLDKTINAVMKMARDSLFKRLIKLTKQTPSERVFRINKSHQDSVAICSSEFSVVKEGEEWIVNSSNGDSKYSITKVQEVCEELCMKCSFCNICIHSFKCSCHDSVIKMNICKHIHALCRVFLLSVESDVVTTVVENDIDSVMEKAKLVPGKIHVNSTLTCKASEIVNLIGKTELNRDIYQVIEKKLDSVLSLLNNVSSGSKCTKKINVNQKIKPQVRLYSIKKKTKCLKRLSKPTHRESSNIIEGLKSKTQEIINVHTGGDHTYNVS